MGDRVIVVLTETNNKTRKPFFAAIYFHWLGGDVIPLLKDAGKFMRRGDASYASARICGVIHAARPGTLSMGLIEGPDSLDPVDLGHFSHGDAGVVVLDMETGALTAFGGYLEDIDDLGCVEFSSQF
jgi:hypothetical protein